MPYSDSYSNTTGRYSYLDSTCNCLHSDLTRTQQRLHSFHLCVMLILLPSTAQLFCLMLHYFIQMYLLQLLLLSLAGSISSLVPFCSSISNLVFVHLNHSLFSSTFCMQLFCPTCDYATAFYTLYLERPDICRKQTTKVLLKIWKISCTSVALVEQTIYQPSQSVSLCYSWN
jgi:hypothetical protein